MQMSSKVESDVSDASFLAVEGSGTMTYLKDDSATVTPVVATTALWSLLPAGLGLDCSESMAAKRRYYLHGNRLLYELGLIYDRKSKIFVSAAFMAVLKEVGIRHTPWSHVRKLKVKFCGPVDFVTLLA